MKTIKYILWLIILAFLGILFYQNQEYFMATIALKLDLKIASWNWTIPELQNIAYFGICFLTGIILAGIKGLFIKFRMKKIIKLQDAKIVLLNKEVITLKTKLESSEKPVIEKPVIEEPVIEEPA